MENRLCLCDACSGFRAPVLEPVCRPGLKYQSSVRFDPCAECGKLPNDFGTKVYETVETPLVHEALKRAAREYLRALEGDGPIAQVAKAKDHLAEVAVLWAQAEAIEAVAETR